MILMSSFIEKQEEYIDITKDIIISKEKYMFEAHDMLVPMVIEQTSRGERSFDILLEVTLKSIGRYGAVPIRWPRISIA